jgi:ABC-type polysaccharide/polyol phosphate export permease
MTDLNIAQAMVETHRAPPAPPTMSQHAMLAAKDFRAGLRNWRMWLLLGMNDIRQRYRRSRMGQFWITLAMATTIVSLGILYSLLFKLPVAQYLPYLGASFVVWGLISSIVLESCTVFIGAEGYMRQVPMPKTVFVHRMLVRNAVVFLHNLAILPPLFLIYHVPVGWTLLLALLALALIMVNGIWVGLLLGTICARFRDMPQIIGSLIQVVFYLTPVMWRPSQLPDRLSWLTNFNPFQSFLDIVRDPLLGELPPLLAWKVAGAVTLVGFAVATLFFSRFRARIVYWL